MFADGSRNGFFCVCKQCAYVRVEAAVEAATITVFYLQQWHPVDLLLRFTSISLLRTYVLVVFSFGSQQKRVSHSWSVQRTYFHLLNYYAFVYCQIIHIFNCEIVADPRLSDLTCLIWMRTLQIKYADISGNKSHLTYLHKTAIVLILNALHTQRCRTQYDAVRMTGKLSPSHLDEERERKLFISNGTHIIFQFHRITKSIINCRHRKPVDARFEVRHFDKNSKMKYVWPSLPLHQDKFAFYYFMMRLKFHKK